MKKTMDMMKCLNSNKKIMELFTRKEEYAPSFLDKHQRFPYQVSNHKNVFDPVVSKFLFENGFEFCWPEEKKFALCLTHDIDNLYPSLKYRGFTSLKFASRLKLRSASSRFFKKDNPYRNFEDIIKLEDKYKAISSFYIMSDGSNYNVDVLKNELGYLIDAGREIGLHGGYHAYNDIHKIKQQKEKLENIVSREVIGYRNHYLRFKVPDTWELLSNAGFKYDTTLGYPNTVGFRNGMCYPFKPFNLTDNKEINIFEIPLILMDRALFKHMKLSENDSWQLCKNLINTVEDLGGVLTIIWHNDSFDGIYYKGWGKLYKKILEYCYEKNAWMTSANEIWEWWVKKNGYKRIKKF